MSLQLDGVTLTMHGETYIDNACLTLEPGSFNVLLGHTLAGKTTLMRLMAGLDRPDRGRILVDGRDVTGEPVRRRNISMVYQQFINYPTLTVFDNIASPLRQARVARREVTRRVEETAAMLGIDNLLDRYPQALSGGQQQRTAMARALVKDADVILFDEPLVNLDYKLREALRHEMRKLFASRHTIAVYATTEPAEALALGGTTTLLHEGRIIQSGSSDQVYRAPCNREAARLYGEPPINLVAMRRRGQECHIGKGALPVPSVWQTLPDGDYSLGVRPHHLLSVPAAEAGSPGRQSGSAVDSAGEVVWRFPAYVRVAEISGSETFLHIGHGDLEMVAHLEGIHELDVDQALTMQVACRRLFVFDAEGNLLLSPSAPQPSLSRV
ncbi:ABC transporter ATP-binding protein [Salinicola avicenniae]|uniref:ABC transporter ATP-binding protein n=1 Tax=Salinicola avicenniae TaxID=2916836 RepID=UPI0020736D96|nr:MULTISPECIES: ABC transporter ATP-binding protein [unclassified Salinicola]